MSVDASASEPPPAALRTESFRKERPSIVGDDVPEAPYPIRLSGIIQRGFGRGGRDLGCHTGTRLSIICLNDLIRLNRAIASTLSRIIWVSILVLGGSESS